MTTARNILSASLALCLLLLLTGPLSADAEHWNGAHRLSLEAGYAIGHGDASSPLFKPPQAAETAADRTAGNFPTASSKAERPKRDARFMSRRSYASAQAPDTRLALLCVFRL